MKSNDDEGTAAGMAERLVRTGGVIEYEPGALKCGRGSLQYGVS